MFHGDIKPVSSEGCRRPEAVTNSDLQTNILVGDRDGPVAWVADFDMAGEMREDGTLPTHGSENLRYLSPEMATCDELDFTEREALIEKADIYSLGLTVYEVCFTATFRMSLPVHLHFLTSDDDRCLCF